MHQQNTIKGQIYQELIIQEKHNQSFNAFMIKIQKWNIASQKKEAEMMNIFIQIQFFYNHMTKLSSSLIFAITFILTNCYKHTMEPQPQNQLLQSSQQPTQQLRAYKYLYPSEKVYAGWFKSYQFDLRFEEIKGAPVSKNLFEGAIDYIGFRLSHETKGKRSPKTDQDFEQIQKQLPMVPTNFSQQTQKDIRYTWIGHSTAVIQIGPDNFIIDPVFKQKKSTKRYRKPACKIHQLPHIDVVLVSHDHYDHFDTQSIEEIQERFQPLFILGLGSEDILPKNSKRKLLDWTEETIVKLKGGEYKITFVPACHWARRGVSDLNARLWGGFIIQSPFGHTIYYSGDTGYTGIFNEIGHKFGPIDLAILPIGAYQPRQFLKAQHVNPEQSVLIHKQIKSKQSVGVHWGTFSMGRQGFIQPKYDLQKACKQHGLKEGDFITVKHGEATIFKKK